MVVRLLPGDARVLGVLVVNDLPVLWREVGLRQGDEASTLISATRSLMAVSKDCGVQSPLGAVMLHGRADLLRLLDVDWIESRLGAPVQWFRDSVCDGGQVAYGLALGCLNAEERAKNIVNGLLTLLATPEHPDALAELGENMLAHRMSLTLHTVPDTAQRFLVHVAVGMPPEKSFTRKGMTLPMAVDAATALAMEHSKGKLS